MSTSGLLSTLAILRLDPRSPPTPLGGDLHAFAPGVELRVLPRLTLHLPEGALPPPGALPLGGRSYLLPARDPSAAIDLALRLGENPGWTAFPDVLLPTRPAASGTGGDPDRGGQWYLDRLEMDRLHERSLGSPDVRVAVIDSGIDIGHPDLAEAVVEPYDAFADDEDPSPDPGEYCPDGGQDICDEHGTAVAGVILARKGNGEGIVGMCPRCTLIPIKMLGEGPGNSLSSSLAAFEHAIAADAAVINNSWGYTSAIPVPSTLAAVIERAGREPRGGRGALVVFAAGNDDREIGADELQAAPGVLCVSAVDSYGYPTNYTNYGDPVDVAAPSATVSIVPGGGVTTSFGGTSAAAPVVSGLAAWALSIAPELSAEELGALLIETATPSPLVSHDEVGHNDYYGYGLVDAIALAERLEPAAEEEPEEPRGGCGCRALPLSPGPALMGLLVLARRRR